ncbi:MAG: hypothetical protein IT348_10565 [Candidatus Eisenbacteria bacterium]|nr:hypothetical protein [Candidatus Eisenbacteria bacterium]
MKSLRRDRRVWLQRFFLPGSGAAAVEGMREGEQRGGLRRQFVRVPVQELPPGAYLLEVRVRDREAGTEEVREAEFTRLPETGR